MSLYDQFKAASNATAFNEALRELCERVETLEAERDHPGGPLVVRRPGRPRKAA